MATKDNSNNGLAPGFRLKRLEVRNWGTFHEKIHILDTAGETALLLGENGSGKSTLVDALLTLLVPKMKRNYNLSAGGLKKRERDEKTYILGAYGSESTAEDLRAQTKYLRKPGGAPSILLSVFENAATTEFVTIAQILWIQDDDARKLYLISRSERSIQSDFGGLGESRGWKKGLRSKGFEVDDSFSEYAEKIVRYLRMESTTTLALFSQTVAIKEITHISSFIRDHMLDKVEAKELIGGLERHYEDLKACWEAIRKAKEQLVLLAPVVGRAAEIKAVDEQLFQRNRILESLPWYFANRTKALLEDERSVIGNLIEATEGEIKTLTDALDELDKQQFSLKQAIDNDEVGKQLIRARQDYEGAVALEAKRSSCYAQYKTALIAIGIHDEVTSEQQFNKLHEWAMKEQRIQTELIAQTANQAAAADQEFKRLRSEIKSIEVELESLRNRRDLIPEAQRRMRTVIANGAAINVADLPFAGELMDVKPEYQVAWRGALERLLRNFGLSLLVPEHLYSRVNHFINNNDLRGRVVYHRIPPHVSSSNPSHDRGRVIERMIVKDDSILAKWVGNELRNHFNHRCCETISEFETSSGFALTKQGLIRSAGTRHDKDDRTAINDPRNHILGWSNADKIAGLERERHGLAVEAQTHAEAINSAKRNQRSAIARADQATAIIGFRTFDEIDWNAASMKKKELKQQMEELEKSSDKIKKLQEQLDQVKSDIKAKDSTKAEFIGKRGVLKDKFAEREQRLLGCDAILELADPAKYSELEPSISSLLGGKVLTVENATESQYAIEREINNQRTVLHATRSKGIQSATRAMSEVLSTFPELKGELTASEEYIAEFLRMEEIVRGDDLPRHEHRFQELMSRDVLVHVVKFQDTLETHCEEMQIKIDHLNTALKSIEYSPSTQITIRATATSDPDVRGFRGRLRSCLEFGLAPDAAAREASFHRISELIDHLRNKPDWASKVTDTRNWLTFAVEECEISTGKQQNLYEDTSGKSGGQKAKLAFTILASAVAFQYGIAKERQSPNSFRFVVIDEMFSRSDETNSRYALRLFAQFHLQLLIVCPFDARARVVEPFVRSYHLALNPTTQSSTVRTVSVEEVRTHLAHQFRSQPNYVGT